MSREAPGTPERQAEAGVAVRTALTLVAQGGRPNKGLVRHEVVCVAVMTVQTGHNLVFCHQYPTSTCVTGNGGV